MAALTVKEILGAYYLTDMVEEIKTGLPNFVPDEFYNLTEDVICDSFRHIRTSGTRQTALQAPYMSVPRRVNMSGLSSQDIKLLHSTEELHLPYKDFMMLHNYTDLNVQQLGLQEVKRQVTQFRARMDNLEITSMTSVFANDGKIFFDSSGNILPTSSGADLTVDAGVPAANLNQCSSSISASWATAGTDIPGDILRLKDLALQTTGYSLEQGYAMYGINIPKYFAANTAMKEFLFRNQGPNGLDYANSYLMRGEIPDGLFNLKWRRMSGSFFNDQTDTKQTLWDGDRVVFTPPPTKQWFAHCKGSHPVPRSWGIMPTAQGVLDNYELMTGKSVYAYQPLPPNPPGANLVSLTTWLPWLKVNNAVWFADTVF